MQMEYENVKSGYILRLAQLDLHSLELNLQYDVDDC